MPLADTLIRTLTELLHQHPDIQAAWLGGSYGRGDHDAYSDIDIVACTHQDATAVMHDVRTQIDAMQDVVFSKTLPASTIINAITRNWDRFDISIVTRDHLNGHYQNEIKALFDRHSVIDTLPATRPQTPFPKMQLQDITEEFIRILGLLPVVLGRENHVSATSGIQIMKDLLIKLMKLEYRHANGPQPHIGALSLKKTISAENYAALDAFPPVTQKPDAIITLNEHISALFLHKAKALYGTHGMVWPHDFVQAALDHLVRNTSFRASTL